MRYASIDTCEICNGSGFGVSLFVQGCHFHCKGCFNRETWPFTGGHVWTPQREQEFFGLIARPYIRRVSILGGEPLARENRDAVLTLLLHIRHDFPDKAIWVYTGYPWEDLMADADNTPHLILHNCDVVVDGRFMENLRDLTLPFRGSSNQRVIDAKASVASGEIVLWEPKNWPPARRQGGKT